MSHAGVGLLVEQDAGIASFEQGVFISRTEQKLKHPIVRGNILEEQPAQGDLRGALHLVASSAVPVAKPRHRSRPRSKLGSKQQSNSSSDYTTTQRHRQETNLISMSHADLMHNTDSFCLFADEQVFDWAHQRGSHQAGQERRGRGDGEHLVGGHSVGENPGSARPVCNGGSSARQGEPPEPVR